MFLNTPSVTETLRFLNKTQSYKVYSASHLSPACDEKKQNECFVFKVKKGDMMFQDKLVMLFENPHSVIVS